MSELKFTKATDQEHTVKLDSALISASWQSGQAFSGYRAKFRIQTAFVGDGATIEVTGKSTGGKKLGKVKGEIFGNVFVGRFDVSEDIEIGDEIFYEVKLSKNGLSGESESIPVLPPPKIKKLEWGAEEARRGDILDLKGEFEDVNDNADVMITIYEFDQNDAHDKITQFPSVLKGKKLEAKWAYEYFEDTDEIPTHEEMERYGGSYNPPEYFYTVTYNDFEMGKEEQDSGILTFKDYIEINLKDAGGNPVEHASFTIHLPDGSTKDGQTDAEGYAHVDGIPPGHVTVEFPDQEQVDSDEHEEE